MLRARDVPALAKLGQFSDIEYQPSEVHDLVTARQVASLFKKNASYSVEDVCAAKAASDFERAERRNSVTNKRLDFWYIHDQEFSERHPDVARFVSIMQADIKRLLGDPADFTGKLPELIRLTNGATEDRPRTRSYPFLKVTGQIRAKLQALPVLGRLFLNWGVELTSLKFTRTDWNTVVLVAKNCFTHRTIAKEATHTLPLQLAVDQWFKAKLKRWGVDLSDQSANQKLAYRGSLTGEFATIDLEMASNTMAYNAVALMLPLVWLNLLDAFRSERYVAPWTGGAERQYSMYSSMGNGFTFSLETIIFTAAVRAVGSKTYAVYGDDIALETELAPKVIGLLKYLGFRTNDEKSFINPDSRFREACGCDYYKGILVTPWYLRENPKIGDRAGMSHVLNGLVSVAPEGALWQRAADDVRNLSLAIVPWNDSAQSGIFVTPRAAWNSKVLTVERRRMLPGPKGSVRKDNPDFGHPVFQGYGDKRDCRVTAGWRSNFLWHLSASYKGEWGSPVVMLKSAIGAKRLLDRIDDYDGDIRANCPSSTTVRVRMVHKTVRFSPKPYSTPSYIYLWEKYVIDQTAV